MAVRIVIANSNRNDGIFKQKNNCRFSYIRVNNLDREFSRAFNSTFITAKKYVRIKFF